MPWCSDRYKLLLHCITFFSRANLVYRALGVRFRAMQTSNSVTIPARCNAHHWELGLSFARRRVQRGRHVSVVEETVGVDPVKWRPVVRHPVQQTTDEVASRHRDVLRYRVLGRHDPHVGLLEGRRLERRTTAQQRVPAERTEHVRTTSVSRYSTVGLGFHFISDFRHHLLALCHKNLAQSFDCFVIVVLGRCSDKALETV